MEPIILTPRLKLTLITKAERGSQEFEWMHELRSDPQSMFWSLGGHSKSVEETEQGLKHRLPKADATGYEKYHVVYAVHEILNPAPEGNENGPQNQNLITRFIGRVDLQSLGPHDLVLPEHLVVPTDEAPTTLTSELAYAFLPSAWGKGYATESIAAVLNACKNVPSFYAPWDKAYVRVIVNEKNPPSLRVMGKMDGLVGMVRKGVYEWRGKPVWINGEWREEDRIVVFGMYLFK